MLSSLADPEPDLQPDIVPEAVAGSMTRSELNVLLPKIELRDCNDCIERWLELS